MNGCTFLVLFVAMPKRTKKNKSKVGLLTFSAALTKYFCHKAPVEGQRAFAL
jgi:hypothetical protein